MSTNYTLFLRLAGPMQSWGTASRLQIRRTDAYPSKSGVLGLLVCAKGVHRENSEEELTKLNELRMGVRVDRPGTLDWDYHTTGAKIGIRRADGKGIKRTESTGEIEVQLSRRQYLLDASFLVALQGDASIIYDCVKALEIPRWPIYLGRKCCVPTETVFVGTGEFVNLEEALSSQPWQPRIWNIDRHAQPKEGKLDVYLECPSGSTIPKGAKLVYDTPRRFGYWNHEPRFVEHTQVTIMTESRPSIRRPKSEEYPDPYGPVYEAARPIRLKWDHYLCVFCKSPYAQVHHLDYKDVRPETLRSLCQLCHDACTSFEYGTDLHSNRFDPADPSNREIMLRQIAKILAERRFNRRREILEAGREFGRSNQEGR